ncbi:hypothetical protein CANARDRAFT_107768 [[Candida] arabinofermentans NRRL YB-2248]|uniref:Sm domain-containing protein n=1 Tax=[Candida] arabinofermentans NRRL YB-2248 TaxID=983967 RepID=A0A1E4SU14_9ASCO|nr:hypothetical protein CANARDRAFT_107768 [[Candida] arabinofermentans NRRL YB-2248]
MSQYIGNTISLISQSDIRYVGTLENIDASKGTISLKSVRVFGTEGRISDPSKIMYPSSEIFDQIMLSGPDVKTLNILEIPVDQVIPEPVPAAFNPLAQYYIPTPTPTQSAPSPAPGPVPSQPAPAQVTPVAQPAPVAP